MGADVWRKLAAGVDCPFDSPRAASTEHWEHVAPLSCSSLYLPKNQTYRGHCILVLDLRHATRPDQLARQEWQRFCDDLYVAQHAIESVVRADHINVATRQPDAAPALAHRAALRKRSALGRADLDVGSRGHARQA